VFKQYLCYTWLVSTLLQFTRCPEYGIRPVSYPVGTGGSTSVVMRPKLEANHSSPPPTEVQNTWIFTSISQCIFMGWCLRGQTTLHFKVTFSPCHHTAKTWGDMKSYLHVFLISAGGWWASVALSPGKEPRDLLDRRLGGTQSRSGRHRQTTNPSPLPVLELRFFSCLSSSLVAIPTGLSLLFIRIKFKPAWNLKMFRSAEIPFGNCSLSYFNVSPFVWGPKPTRLKHLYRMSQLSGVFILGRSQVDFWPDNW
jgi:hypothetical protein